jgi:hypothetical protein
MGKIGFFRRKEKGGYRQGVFQPTNPGKYKGTIPIIFRSGYEEKFCRFCDINETIISWGSESVVVEYFDPVKQKIRRYYVDFVITLKDGKTILIEVKPEKQTRPPKKAGKKTDMTLLREQRVYATNQAKWEAATNVCKKKGWIFKIMTERDLNI